MIGWLRELSLKDGLIAVLMIVVLAFGQKMAAQHAELVKVREVYAHPKVQTVEKVVYRLGPVRTRTVVVKDKSGGETTTIEEERGPVTAEADNDTESAPVPLAETLKEPRADRWLVSVGANRLSADLDGKAAFVGYGWGNRFDLQVGGVECRGFSPWLLATIRF